MNSERLHLIIEGQVQGVGFRPHVYRIAHELALSGFVLNTANGVEIEIQGPNCRKFIEQLQKTLPTLARIDKITQQAIPSLKDSAPFKIMGSENGLSKTMIAPDTCICDACLDELFDPNSRYYHYAFLNCMHCGPRLSITQALPYDRKNTSMRAFPLCAHCHSEYHDAHNRRYHAQPIACEACGPSLSSSIDDIVKTIRAGKIVALKGLGGYQFICDANNNEAILRLRQKKNRPAKPFAIMQANIESVKSIVDLDELSQELLLSPARPIVLIKKQDSSLAESIDFGLAHLGIMLPSTPLHYLLFHALAGKPQGHEWLKQALPYRLIVSSANMNGDPIIIEDEKAYQELSKIADLVVSHNRAIVAGLDDSVIQIIKQKPAFIRRARGFAPQRIKLPFAVPETLALGGQLKNTFCITRGDEAFVSQHNGSLNNKASIEFFHQHLSHWLALLEVKPKRIACDLHPDFYTSQLAHEYELTPISVQHHHAHLVSVATEHHLTRPTLGVALDGYGYGDNSESWGGELFLFDHQHYQRMASLEPLPQVGGDKAAREPWRMGAAVLHLLGKNAEISDRFKMQTQAQDVANLLKSKMPIAKSSSCGRLFDAASALLGINHISSYEGQAALQLESLVQQPETLANGFTIKNGQLSMLPTLNYLLKLDPIRGANLFHGSLIEGLGVWVTTHAKQLKLQDVVLSGGCFLNKILTEGLTGYLTKQGLCVYLAKDLPPNDGGLCLGQAFIAATKKM